MRWKLWVLCLFSHSAALAERPWRHYNLDVRLTVPSGWRLIQGPVMVQLSPNKPWKGERRPSMNITWQQNPPTFTDFRQQLDQRLQKQGGKVLQSDTYQTSGFPCLFTRIQTLDNGVPVAADAALIRVDDYRGYLAIGECLQVDASRARPVFQQILASLRVGPRPRPKQLPLQE
ncbi:MAG: hypothetical protein U0931_11790 [Vulcanimicrobiota bacterium]